MNNVVIFVLAAIHCNRRFVPKQNGIFDGMKCLHVKHGVQIGLNVADNDVDIVSDAVIDFANAARSPVARGFFCGEIMQAYVVDTFAPECECDALLNGDCRFC